MGQYKSDVAHIATNIDTIYSKLSNPETLQKLADMLPEDARGKVENVSFSSEGLKFQVPAAGEISLNVTEKVEPTLIVYSAISSPVPFKLVIDLTKVDADHTDALATIDVDIPVFLKPMVQGPLNDACKKMGEFLSFIPYDKI